jgi:hypothetical protein
MDFVVVRLPAVPSDSFKLMVISQDEVILDMARKNSDPVREAIGTKTKALSLAKTLGVTVQECEGSRIAFVFSGVLAVFHWPHPSPLDSKCKAHDV